MRPSTGIYTKVSVVPFRLLLLKTSTFSNKDWRKTLSRYVIPDSLTEWHSKVRNNFYQTDNIPAGKAYTTLRKRGHRVQFYNKTVRDTPKKKGIAYTFITKLYAIPFIFIHAGSVGLQAGGGITSHARRMNGL